MLDVCTIVQKLANKVHKLVSEDQPLFLHASYQLKKTLLSHTRD